MSNPLLEQTGLPAFSAIKPEHVEPAIDALLAENRSRIADLLDLREPTVSHHLAKLKELDLVLASHQDPDIIASLDKWIHYTGCTVAISRLWDRFLPHLIPSYAQSNTEGRIVSIPDRGAEIAWGRTSILALPAHFLHSVGNFSFYDPVSKILFSISKRKGHLKAHNTWSSMLASSLTVGFGGSVGLEAPIVLTGSSIASKNGSGPDRKAVSPRRPARRVRVKPSR